MRVVTLYTAQIVLDDEENWSEDIGIDDLMAEAEENLTDLLPPGYRARIRRWDHNDEPDDTWTDTVERELPRRKEPR